MWDRLCVCVCLFTIDLGVRWCVRGVLVLARKCAWLDEQTGLGFSCVCVRYYSYLLYWVFCMHYFILIHASVENGIEFMCLLFLLVQYCFVLFLCPFRWSRNNVQRFPSDLYHLNWFFVYVCLCVCIDWVCMCPFECKIQDRKWGWYSFCGHA